MHIMVTSQEAMGWVFQSGMVVQGKQTDLYIMRRDIEQFCRTPGCGQCHEQQTYMAHTNMFPAFTSIESTHWQLPHCTIW